MKPDRMIRAKASVVSSMNPIGGTRPNSSIDVSRIPWGAVGCTSTGSPSRSISDQTGANAGSVRSRPAILASTMTPTAPAATARVAAAPEHVGAGQRDDCEVDAGRIHGLDPQFVIPHARHERHEGSAV